MRKLCFRLIFLDFIDAANIITIINITMSFASIFLASQGLLSVAAIVLCLAASIDFLDGYVARTWFSDLSDNRLFGSQLDSLADLLNFSVAPGAVLVISSDSRIAIIAAVMLVMSGAIRLSVFSVVNKQMSGAYLGLPTTYAGFVFAILFKLLALGLIGGFFVCISMMAVSLLQVVNIRIKKFNSISTIVFFISTYAIVYCASDFFLQ
jgi:CDP-diacylglycerol---serine O-phosphatidyltransferase